MKMHRSQSTNRLKNAFHITPSGKAMVLSMSFVLLAAAIIPALGVFACLLATLICSLIFGFVFKPRVNITITLPDHVSAGSEVTVSYRIENTCRAHSFCLNLNLQDLPTGWVYTGSPLIVPHLKPHDVETVQVAVMPTRRGQFTLPCPACYSSFPFHLFSFNVAKGPGATITVLPAYDTIQLETLSDSPAYQYAGFGGSLHPTHLPEYAGNRPFIAGDSLRHIDSRAWARLAEPVVKEYHNDVRRSCILWLQDHRTSRPAASDWDKDFEAAISLCASLAYSFGRNTLVDSLVVGQACHDLRSINTEARLPGILDILAKVMPDPKADTHFEIPEPCLRSARCVYALYLGDHDIMESHRCTFEHAGVELHTLHVSQAPDHEMWVTRDSGLHWEIDANAILANQVGAL